MESTILTSILLFGIAAAIIADRWLVAKFSKSYFNFGKKILDIKIDLPIVTFENGSIEKEKKVKSGSYKVISNSQFLYHYTFDISKYFFKDFLVAKGVCTLTEGKLRIESRYNPILSYLLAGLISYGYSLEIGATLQSILVFFVVILISYFINYIDYNKRNITLVN